MHLTLKERREINKYKLTNNLQETDREDLILRRKEEARNLGGHKKTAKRNLFEQYKKAQFSPKHRYMEWNKRRVEKCTSTEGKTGQI